MMQAVLSNAAHPEYGVATIPFPIPIEQFGHCIELVEALEIGNVSAHDCHVNEIHSVWPVLNRLEGKGVNLEELDYLAKRLDGFDIGEAAQFQAMAEKLDLTDMKDFENLEGFYNYEQYGLQRLEQDYGEFNDCGYIAYRGIVSLQELMSGGPSGQLSQTAQLRY